MEVDGVAPRFLGLVHGLIRPLQDVVLAGLVVYEDDDANACRTAMGHTRIKISQPMRSNPMQVRKFQKNLARQLLKPCVGIAFVK